MCDQDNPKLLPPLPGFAFADIGKSNFHRSQYFTYEQGIPGHKNCRIGSGRAPTDGDSLRYFDFEPLNHKLNPELIYGRPKKSSAPPFRPHYVHYDRMTLHFRGYFREKAYNTADETHRIRIVEVFYFVEDDTVTVIEPVVRNSGLPQGRLVRRSRIPLGPPPDCEYLHWKDLNVGIDVRLCGYLVRIVDCDPFTRDFLQSQGIVINDSEEIPVDDFVRQKFSSKFAVPCDGPTLSSDKKFRKFLQYDGVVFRFGAVRPDECGEKGSNYSIAYYLADDTVQISQIHEPNDGKDPNRVLLKRTRLPKNSGSVPVTYPSFNEQLVMDMSEFYQPQDFIVGKTIEAFGKQFFVQSCDNFTRSYYSRAYNIIQPENMIVKRPEAAPPSRPLPPYNGFGTLEDSLQSCLSFTPKTPRKDTVKMMVNVNHFLRYKAKLQSTHPEDAVREFVISYSLADSTFIINELPVHNSGFKAGKFLQSTRIQKPGFTPDYPEYYSPQDLSIGSVMIVNDFRFEITGADLHVYSYMRDNMEKFRPEVVDSIKNYLECTGQLKRVTFEQNAMEERRGQPPTTEHDAHSPEKV